MRQAQALARHQQRVEELCAASIRALSAQADLHFRGRRLHRGKQVLPLFAPHLHPALESADFASFRGAADGLALRLRLSDSALHLSLCPSDPVARLVFELLEQFRTEALVPDTLPGVRRNLRHCFDTWARAFHDGGLTGSVSGMLMFSVAQVCRARVTNEPIHERYEDMLESARGELSSLIGTQLAALRRARHDQAQYAVHALAIAAAVAGRLQDLAALAGQSRAGGENDAVYAFALLMDIQGDLTDRYATAVSGRSRVLEAVGGGYQVFTTAYDRQRSAASLVRKDLRLEYRERLDQRIREQGINLMRLSRELRALLALPAIDGWDGGQEEGQIDGRALAQLVVSPTERRLFRQQRAEPRADCVVSFLIDCSGSMKQHIETLAVLLDVFVRALELAGVSSEILGFTTGAWNGGRSQKDWLARGRPEHPGRLNEVCHMVFKDADTAWRRARPDIAALLKADLFREGVDGEAVLWASSRLYARTEQRKLLVVVSDGSPMDSATNLANDAHYLDHHLRDVVQAIETAGRIGIYGLGVGLDLSPYYSRSHVLDLELASVNQILREIAMLIGSRAQR